MGMNLFDSGIAKKELHYYGLYDKAKTDYDLIKEKATAVVSNLQTTNDFPQLFGPQNVQNSTSRLDLGTFSITIRIKFTRVTHWNSQICPKTFQIELTSTRKF